jgi:hypothetical protein
MSEATFVVIPFIAGRGASLFPASPLRIRTEAYARAVAEEAAPIYAGVAVIEQPSDEFEEPKLIKAIGRIPDMMLDCLAA